MTNKENDIRAVFEKLEIQPSEGVWKAIHNQNMKLGSTRRLFSYAKLFVAVLSLAVISTVAYLVFQKDNVEEIVLFQEVLQEETLVSEHYEEENTTYVVEDLQEQDSLIVAPAAPVATLVEEEVDDKKEMSVVETKTVEGISIESVKETNVDTLNVEEDNSSVEVVVKELNFEADNKSFEADTAETREIDTVVETVLEEKVVDSFVVEYGENPTVCFGEDAILIVEKGYSYRWNTGDVKNEVTVSPVETSSYFVTVTNQSGQQQEHEFKVIVDNTCSAVFVPSAFTPNSDGRNDVFKVEGRGIRSVQLVVMNRFGQVMFEATAMDQAWDGQFEGKPQPSGSYVYYVKYVDAKGNDRVKKGQVVLIR